MPEYIMKPWKASDTWTIWLRRALTLVGMILGGAGLVWGVKPLAQSEHELTFNAAQMEIPGIEMQPELVELRMVLTYPKKLRAGDPSEARMVLWSERRPDPQDQPVLEERALFVETRLELPGLTVDPDGVAGQALPLDRAVTFWWRLSGKQSGEYEGTAWLNLRSGSFTRPDSPSSALAAPKVHIRVERFLGLDATMTRWIGGLLVGIGFLLLMR